MICNNPRDGYRGWILRKKVNEKTLNDWIDEWHTVNLNSIIFDENQFNKTINYKNRNGIIYYGTFRKHRIKDMLPYNQSGYYLSSSKKNHEKYRNAGINAKFIEKILWHEKDSDLFDMQGLRLKDFNFSLYFEDEHTHSNYAFMANRFYEAVMNNTLMIYDHRCKLTIEKSEFNIHPMQVVKNESELVNLTEQLSIDNFLYYDLLSVQQSNVNKILQEKKAAFEIIKNIINQII
jgi:hypothetical protein